DWSGARGGSVTPKVPEHVEASQEPISSERSSGSPETGATGAAPMRWDPVSQTWLPLDSNGNQQAMPSMGDTSLQDRSYMQPWVVSQNTPPLNNVPTSQEWPSATSRPIEEAGAQNALSANTRPVVQGTPPMNNGVAQQDRPP